MYVQNNAENFLDFFKDFRIQSMKLKLMFRWNQNRNIYHNITNLCPI